MRVEHTRCLFDGTCVRVSEKWLIWFPPFNFVDKHDYEQMSRFNFRNVIPNVFWVRVLPM